jgi:hypothetical protein
MTATIKTPVLGMIIPGSGVVFFIDDLGMYGLEARLTDEKGDESDKFDWWEALLTFKSNNEFNWRLPNKIELNLLYQQKNIVGNFSNSHYWCSDEADKSNAYSQGFYDGYQYNISKVNTLSVRAVRKFSIISSMLSGVNYPGRVTTITLAGFS